jgi:hypothetical protein
VARRTAGKVDELKLALARSLFRADKWAPERDATRPFDWEPQRAAYIARADRLLRTFAKDGLDLSIAPLPPE